jgi:hypothetical protein
MLLGDVGFRKIETSLAACATTLRTGLDGVTTGDRVAGDSATIAPPVTTAPTSAPTNAEMITTAKAGDGQGMPDRRPLRLPVRVL